jgi:GT2 family glycosyltransferase
MTSSSNTLAQNDDPFDVAIVLLNYGHVEKTLACLDSLKLVTGPSYQIFIVDNASPDDSLLHLRERLDQQNSKHSRALRDELATHSQDAPSSKAEYHPEFTLIESTHNLGYSGGCNLAIRAMRARLNAPRYIWLLNNDTLVDANALHTLFEEAERTKGLAGSLLLYPDNRYQQVGTRFNPWTGNVKGYPEEAVSDHMPVQVLCGASMLIPMRTVARVGLLDERYFLYFEDVEYSLRCARAGFSLTVATHSIVYHHESASTGKSSAATQYYFQRNRLKLLSQIATPLQKVTFMAYALFRFYRAWLKSLPMGKNAEKLEQNRLALEVYQKAFQDFLRGVDGKCPHHFTHSK